METSSEAAELKNKRTYLCRRCLNHGASVKKSGHVCEFAYCDCPSCNLLSERKRLNLERKVMSNEGKETSPDSQSSSPTSADKGTPTDKTKRGCRLYCCFCRNHGILNSYKIGHKKDCPFYDHCDCTKCAHTRKYNTNMSRQMWLRRKQKKLQTSAKAETTRLPSSLPSAIPAAPPAFPMPTLLPAPTAPPAFFFPRLGWDTHEALKGLGMGLPLGMLPLFPSPTSAFSALLHSSPFRLPLQAPAGLPPPPPLFSAQR